MGAVRAIDRCDIDADDRVIHLRHRPEEPDAYGTPLKNGANDERIINISPQLMELIQAYLTHNRDDTTDEYGRAPLFTTAHGRVTTTTMRRDLKKDWNNYLNLSTKNPEYSEKMANITLGPIDLRN